MKESFEPPYGNKYMHPDFFSMKPVDNEKDKILELDEAPKPKNYESEVALDTEELYKKREPLKFAKKSEKAPTEIDWTAMEKLPANHPIRKEYAGYQEAISNLQFAVKQAENFYKELASQFPNQKNLLESAKRKQLDKLGERAKELQPTIDNLYRLATQAVSEVESSQRKAA